MAVVTQKCILCHEKHDWSSQPFIADKPAGNILLSAAILFCGATPTKVLRVLEHLGVSGIHLTTFHLHQRTILAPVVQRIWHQHQTTTLCRIKAAGRPISLSGDGRADSPGHCAKFGCYTLLDVNSGQVLHTELVQVGNVQN